VNGAHRLLIPVLVIAAIVVALIYMSLAVSPSGRL
jgi:hypothetical protein